MADQRKPLSIFKKRCQGIKKGLKDFVTKNEWGEMGISTQISIRLVSFMLIYIVSFMIISMYLLQSFYLPDINWHVYDEVGFHFAEKVSNMTLTTALRIDGFDRLQKENA
jgi:hypothetical protein